MELKEIEKRLEAIKWFSSFSIYCGKDFYEIKVYRNRHATVSSGLRDEIENAISATIEQANEHDERVRRLMHERTPKVPR